MNNLTLKKCPQSIFNLAVVKRTILLAGCLIGLYHPGLSHGAGFSNFTQGAGPMGAGNATIAHHEGISSIYYNPALQLEFDKTNLAFGMTLLKPTKKLDSSITMQSYESESNIYYPIHVTATHRMSEKVSFAFSVNNSFGLGSEFPEDTVFRYITTKSELTTWDMNPTVAFQVHEDVAVAVGFRAVLADVSLQQMVPLQSFGLSDGRQEFDANGTGYGWNIGATYSPTDQWTLGTGYRSPVNVELSGDVNFVLPANSNPLLTTIFPSSSATSSFDLPGQLFLGVSYPENRIKRTL